MWKRPVEQQCDVTNCRRKNDADQGGCGTLGGGSIEWLELPRSSALCPELQMGSLFRNWKGISQDHKRMVRESARSERGESTKLMPGRGLG